MRFVCQSHHEQPIRKPETPSKQHGKHLDMETINREKPQKCPICWEEDSKKKYSLECGHVFHRKCIYDSTTKKHKNCPICRVPISKSDRRKMMSIKERVVHSVSTAKSLLLNYLTERTYWQLLAPFCFQYRPYSIH